MTTGVPVTGLTDESESFCASKKNYTRVIGQMSPSVQPGDSAGKGGY